MARLQQSVAALGPQAQHAAVLDQAVGRQQAQLEEYGRRIADLEARLRAAEDHRDRLEQQVCLGTPGHDRQRLALLQYLTPELCMTQLCLTGWPQSMPLCTKPIL